MSQATASLIFQDGASERDFTAVSAQNSAITDLHYEFRTVSTEYGNGTQLNTVVTGRLPGQTAPVALARIEWLGRAIGSVRIFISNPPTEHGGASLCLPGPHGGSSRSFFMDRTQYTWTRKNSSYELTGPGSALLARYDRCQTSAQNPPHAILNLYFHDRLLLLMALISLTLNRWLDGPYSPLSTSR